MSNLSLFTGRTSHHERLTLAGYLSECFTNPLLHHLTQAGKTGFRCVLCDVVKSQYIIYEFQMHFIHLFKNSLLYITGFIEF